MTHPAMRAPPAAPRQTLILIATWLLASLLAMFFALLLRDSSLYQGAYVPRSNDSLYHARRILDAVLSSRGFYQFDDRIHVPDGSWIPWPWGYDYLMAKATQLALWLVPTLDPMAFLSHVPVAWILVNAGLFLLATGVVGLSLEMRILAMLCFAISPLTQLLHAIGMLDHHYMELTFVLLAIWLGSRWFHRPDEPWRAAWLGIALGLSQAFHNGLFILQLLPLLCVWALWLRQRAPSPAALRGFCIALLVTTQLILLPSEPYRRMMFEFGLLSWFHFYIALCTTLAMLYMGWRRYTPGNLAGLAVLSIALAAPMAAQLISGAGFLSGSFSILDQIVEAQSPYTLFNGAFGPAATVSFYSWLLFLAPLLLILFVYRVWREHAPARLYFAIVVVFGLAMLLSQFRLHYYGYFGLICAGLLLIDELRERMAWNRGATLAVTLALVALAFQPSLRNRLFLIYATGGDTGYANVLPMFDKLHTLCAREPGTVLASADDGAAIIYHTECRVIGLNFILRKEDAVHLEEVNRLMRLPVEEIRRQRPDVRYLLVRGVDFSTGSGAAAQLSPDSPIARQLLSAQPPPPGVNLLMTLRDDVDENGKAPIYARLFDLAPNGTGS